MYTCLIVSPVAVEYLVPCPQSRTDSPRYLLVSDELSGDAASSRAGPVSEQPPTPKPIHWLTRYLRGGANIQQQLHKLTWFDKIRFWGWSLPLLFWSYCWKPHISSERWLKSFSFRALRAEPSAALTLNTHIHRNVFSLLVYCRLNTNLLDWLWEESVWSGLLQQVDPHKLLWWHN